MADRAAPLVPRWLAIIVLALTALCLALAWWWWPTSEEAPTKPAAPEPVATVQPDPAPADPRLTFNSPFRNTQPQVKYMGDASCITCHEAIVKSYHHHPMGRSAALVGTGPPVEQYTAEANNPAVVKDFELKVEPGQGEARHRMRSRTHPDVPPYDVPVQVAIGSATRGRAYLTVDRGAVWQSPIGWFTHQQQWDVSPGYVLPEMARRPITAECLFCHVDHAEALPGAHNRYQEPFLAGQVNIGCERCHGPGELHVQERLSGLDPQGVDTAIVNPRHLPQELRLAICQQCHLQGEIHLLRRGRGVYDFRPGLPLEPFIAVFARHPDLADFRKSVGQFEQMYESECFTQSAGKMDCTSCHDPHMKPAAEATDAFFRTKCLTCHAQQGCSLPELDRKAKNDSCIACHMPKGASSNISHTAVTDHRVPRKPLAAQPSGPRALQPGTVPLVPLQKGPHLPDEREQARDLAVALGRLAGNMPPWAGSAREIVSRQALEHLAQSLEIFPGDHDAWVAQSRVAAGRDDYALAYQAALNAVALDADSELALSALTSAALGTGRIERAEAAADRLIALNPGSITYRMLRAEAHLVRKNWAGMAAEARAGLNIHPLFPEAHAYLALARAKQGDAEGGRQSLAVAITLASQNEQKRVYREWFADNTRD